ncbi:MAG TPA: Do family serine endopeptidase [Rhodocyclaceae bacterium]|nr:Do family serine endopeptidase [Rhodocyclaceae bacterium]
MKRLWLIFAQAVTLSLAALFVVQTLKPDWLGHRMDFVGAGTGTDVVEVKEEATQPADRRRVASYADAAKQAVPSVVYVFTSQEIRSSRHPLANDPFWYHFFGDRGDVATQRRYGLGSGVVVSTEGYVLTNYHVVEAADEIEVASNDGRRFAAKVVGTDPESDLAVLRVPAEARLVPITFAAADSVRVGDIVLAIGNPFGVGQTVTSGIVSALGRKGLNTFENFIQTDAAINPGNSGGALVDSNGKLVGINTAIYSQTGGNMGIGFAIPVSLARNVMEQIIKTGGVTRGWIGVEVQEMTPELAESFGMPTAEGALIAGVMRNSPADKAGIHPGDVLLAIDGHRIKDAENMLELIATLEPGKAGRITLRRDGREFEVKTLIGKRPKPPRE